MPARTSYEKAYVDACRARVDAQATAYHELAQAAAAIKGSARTQVNGALVALEPMLFNSLVVVLDHCFAHRKRTLEGDDGNAMNEVRVVAASIESNGAVMGVDSRVSLSPATSVLGLKPGDPIALTEHDFRRLSDAYFDAVEAAFCQH